MNFDDTEIKAQIAEIEKLRKVVREGLSFLIGLGEFVDLYHGNIVSSNWTAALMSLVEAEEKIKVLVHELERSFPDVDKYQEYVLESR